MSSSFKGRLDPSGPAGSSFADKAKMLRRPTPDSDAIASSDDEHVPPPPRQTTLAAGRRPSSGWLQDIQPNRKFSLPPVSLAGSVASGANLNSTSMAHSPFGQNLTQSSSAFPWNTNSFTSTANSSARMREALPSPTTASPAQGEGEEGIGFLLNEQNPVRKSVRSQSYSIAQGEIEGSPLGQFSRNSAIRHRPSRPSLLGDSFSGLSQLDESGEYGSPTADESVRPSPGYWSGDNQAKREQKQALLKQAAEQSARARHRAASTASPVGYSPLGQQQARKSSFGQLRHENNHSDFAIEEHDDADSSSGFDHMTLVRRFSEYTGTVSPMGRGADTQSVRSGDAFGNAGMGGIGDSLMRRHSFASPFPSAVNTFAPPNVSYNEEEEDLVSPMQGDVDNEESPEPFDARAYFTGYGPASRALHSSAISAAHPAPSDLPMRPAGTLTQTQNPYAVPPTISRPGRRLYIVSFKCQRADIYYTLDNTGLEIKCGDLVIVEGDRGVDLGHVSHADVTLEEAKRLKAEAQDEHFRWLVMFSKYSLAGAKPEGMLGALALAHGYPNVERNSLTSMGGQQDQDTKPKMIKRVAQKHEIRALRDKEGSEAKAKRLGAQKAIEHKLPMEILDAEFQADYHKLTFFYYAEAYVNFNPLVVDIFKQYKIRIWMSAVNPASVVNPAGLMQIQPPSAIGPGAILPPRSNAPPAVGPGFGAATYRQHDQQRGRGNAQSQYDESFYPFAQQLSGYSQQPSYVGGYNQYNQGYNRYGGYPVAASSYPNVTQASPLNYGAFYPPNSYTPSTYASTPAFQPPSSTTGFRAANNASGYGTGYQAPSSTYNPDLNSMMASMNLGNQQSNNAA